MAARFTGKVVSHTAAKLTMMLPMMTCENCFELDAVAENPASMNMR